MSRPEMSNITQTSKFSPDFNLFSLHVNCTIIMHFLKLM